MLLPVSLLASLALIFPSSLPASVDSFNPESNLLLPSISRPKAHRKEPVARCDGNSICAFLQANSHGVNVVEYCSCEGASKCSLQWDPYDGKSVTQSQSDQYKYCDFVPAVKKCSSRSEVAYTSHQVFKGYEKVQSRDRIHCVCPDGHNYLDTKYDFKEEGELNEVLVDYYCLPLPTCNSTEICKDVTVKPGQYIVNPKCLCSDGMACPSVTKKGVTKTLLGENMELQQVTCQQPQGADHGLSELYASQKLSELYREHFTAQKRTSRKRSLHPSLRYHRENWLN